MQTQALNKEIPFCKEPIIFDGDIDKTDFPQLPFTTVSDFIEKHGHDFPKEESSKSGCEVADIFRTYGEEYRKTHNLTTPQLKAMSAIEKCRTEAFGFHADVCDQCGHTRVEYNSCCNRHCPKCNGIKQRQWVQTRLEELISVLYYHVTFTIPMRLSQLSCYNEKLIYDLIFSAASQTLLKLGQDPKWLGATVGFYGTLHTWSQTILKHVHVHFIMPAGGVTKDGKWVEPKYKGRFIFPPDVAAEVFRGKFIEGLKKLYYSGKLILPPDLDHLENPDEFERWIYFLVSVDWVVDIRRPFSGPEDVVKYIGMYTHRIGISNNRIISVENGEVRFSYKDNKEKDESKKHKEMTLPVDEFIKRYLLHVLPPRYHRIRHYGFLSNGMKNKWIPAIREQLGQINPEQADVSEYCNGRICPVCGNGRMKTFIVVNHRGKIIKCDISVFVEKNDSS